MYRRLLLSLLLLAACRKAYQPPAVAHPPNYLVVEGFIENNGTDTTYFTLSRTVKVDSSAFTPETGARVFVEGSDNTSYSLSDFGNGRYGAALSALSGSAAYRLHIYTNDNKEYASDYVPLVNNPPIDSINWVRQDDPAHNGVAIYANTHDPQNNTH